MINVNYVDNTGIPSLVCRAQLTPQSIVASRFHAFSTQAATGDVSCTILGGF